MVDPSIMLPKELYKIQKDVKLAIDIIKVNNCYFLTSISLHIFYRTAQYLNRLTAVNLAKALEEDNIKFDFCAPNNHVPEAERNN